MSMTLSGRLRAILDHLTTHLGSTRMAKVDTINTNVTALGTNPLYSPPMASGMSVPDGSAGVPGASYASVAAAGGGSKAAVASTTLTDVINYTGSGVLLFACVGASSGQSAKYTLTIDGSVYVTDTDTSASSMTFLAGSETFYDATAGRVGVGFEAVPFHTSIRLQIATVSSGTAYAAWKLRKTA